MNKENTIPRTLLDVNGYPTDEWLEFIKNYQPSDDLPLLKFVKEILPKGWYNADWDVVIHRKYKGKIKLELHTRGWSGNEEVIRAILSNIYLTHFKMQYIEWHAGGHYYFEIYV